MDKTARTHTNLSNRAGAREAVQRRVVFKGVLDNPFGVKWPVLAENVQNVVLARLVALLDDVAEYHLSQKYKATLKKPRKKTPKRIESESMDVDAAAPPAPAPENADDTPGTSEPAILPHLAIGINQVTKRLEAQARLLRQAAFSTSDSSTTVTATHRPLRVVFVCREDIDPPMLVAHIPTLIASYNSASSARSTESLVKLVPLAKGAEFTLAAAFGLRRVAVMALDCDAPDLVSLKELLASVPHLTAAWLTPQPAQMITDRMLEPTHVKQLRTTAPKDMKAAKDDRAKARAAAKEKRKQNPQPSKRRRHQTADKRRKTVKLSAF